MGKLPVIIERTRDYIRGIAFKSSVMGSSFEQSKIHYFESEDFEKQNEELELFIRENYYENAGIYINTPPEEVILREFSVPFISKGKIKDILPFELESQLPYEVSDIFYDYHFYPEKSGNSSKVIVAACRRKFLEPYVQFFLKNNIPLKGIYIQVDAFLQLASFVKELNTNDSQEPLRHLLYISGSFSLFLITQNGTWEYARIVPLGYDHLFKKLSDLWGKKDIESRQLLSETSLMDSEVVDYSYYQSKFKLSKAKSKETVNCLLEFSSSINHEIKSTFIRSPMNKGEKAEKIPNEHNKVILLSDMDNQVFLENILLEKSSWDISGFPYGNTPISLTGRSFSMHVGLSYALASRKFLNFMDSDLKKMFRKKKDFTDRLIYAALGLGLGFLGSSFAFNIIQKLNYYQSIEKRMATQFIGLFNRNPNADTSLLTQAQQLLNEQKKRSEIYKLQSNKNKLSQILFELNQSLMKAIDLHVDRLTYSGNNVTLMGSTGDFSELNNIKNIILDNRLFAEVDLKEQRSYPGPDGKNRVKFSMLIKPRHEEKE